MGTCLLTAQEPELVSQVSGSSFGPTVASAYFGPNGNWLATIEKGTVIIYDLKGERISRRIPLESSEASIAVHPSAGTLAVLDGLSLILYEVETGKPLWKIRVALSCSALRFTYDGERIMGACGPSGGVLAGMATPKNILSNWNARNGAELPGTPLPPDVSATGPFSEDGRWVVGTKAPDLDVTGAFATIRKSMRMMKAIQDHPILDTQTGQVVGHVNGFGVQLLSARAHSAIVLTLGGTLNATYDVQLIDVLTGKALQTYKGSMFPFTSGQVTADGTHFLVADMSGAAIIDATTGQVSHPGWDEVPKLSSVVVAPDQDEVAFVQSGIVVLSRISHPGETRTIGDPVAMAYSQIVFDSASKSLGNESVQIESILTPSKSGSVAKAILGSLVNRDSSRLSRQEEQEFDAIEKQCKAQVKGIKKERDRAQAENDCFQAAQDAKEKQSEDLSAKLFFQSISQFGGPTAFPPMLVSLDSGRLLAILCADYSWGLWDTATGNRLPYHKPFDYRVAKSKDSGRAWFSDSLHEIERDFGATTATDVQPPEGPVPAKTVSEDGLQYYTYFPHQPSYPGETEDTKDYEFDAGIHVWDTVFNQLLFNLPDAMQVITPVVPASGKVLVGADRANTVGIWDRHTGERLGTLYALQEGEWLLITPSGWFDGSPRGWGKVAWRDPNGGLATLPGEAFFNEFYHPGLLAELLEGRSPAPPRAISQVDRRQPRVLLSTNALTVSQRTTTVHLDLSETAPGAGLRDARLFRNGTLVKSWRGDLARQDGHVQYDTEIPLVAGDNRLVAYAFNRDNVKSSDAVINIQCTAPKRRGTAYVLAIGVDKYSNPEFDLKYAGSDADHLAQALVQSENELGDYSQVVQVTLLDQYATKANVLLALSILGGQAYDSAQTRNVPQLASLKLVQPEDLVAIYFAGHGLAWGDHFYLIPHDLGYDGPRDRLSGSLEEVLSHGISDLDLQQAFDPIDPAHILLIIDACNSGKVLDAEDERRGPMNNKGLAQLAYEKGIYVLTAAQAYQAALESSRLGYGYLTYSLTEEGLKTPVADTRPIDGQVSVVEWFEYASRRVPQLQSAALNQSQGDNRQLTFELTPASNPAGIRRLQTPRIYYRRDQPGGETIISKLK
jgi:WD40 repeat protein